MGESPDGERPGALPCQVLDHGTGYLAAAAALDGLRRQAELGGTHGRWLSLARTAWWLATAPPAAPAGAEAAPDRDRSWMARLTSAGGPVSAVAPPGAIAGAGGSLVCHRCGNMETALNPCCTGGGAEEVRAACRR